MRAVGESVRQAPRSALDSSPDATVVHTLRRAHPPVGVGRPVREADSQADTSKASAPDQATVFQPGDRTPSWPLRRRFACPRPGRLPPVVAHRR